MYMKKKRIWKILFLIGLCPFTAPFVYYGWGHIIHNHYSMTLTDILVLWSFVYWPTYIIGFALSALSLYKIRKQL